MKLIDNYKNNNLIKSILILLIISEDQGESKLFTYDAVFDETDT